MLKLDPEYGTGSSDRIPRATVFRVPVDGVIDLGMTPLVARVAEEAAATEGGILLLDINTLGGRVDAAVLIRPAR